MRPFLKKISDGFSLVRAIFVVSLISGLLAVNVYGYLSILPESLIGIIGSDFIFNYVLQVSMYVAVSSLLGWQFGDLAFILTKVVKHTTERIPHKIQYVKPFLFFFTFDFLGKFKSPALRYTAGMISFFYMYSGFSIIKAIIAIFLFIFYAAIIYFYFEIKSESKTKITLTDVADRFFDEVSGFDWKTLDFPSLAVSAVFFALLFSNMIGKERADRILESGEVNLRSSGITGTPFATSDIGLILAVSDKARQTGIEFVVIGPSGKEILRATTNKP